MDIPGSFRLADDPRRVTVDGLRKRSPAAYWACIAFFWIACVILALYFIRLFASREALQWIAWIAGAIRR